MGRKSNFRSQAHKEPSTAQVWAAGIGLSLIVYFGILLASVLLVQPS